MVYVVGGGGVINVTKVDGLPIFRKKALRLHLNGLVDYLQYFGHKFTSMPRALAVSLET